MSHLLNNSVSSVIGGHNLRKRSLVIEIYHRLQEYSLKHCYMCHREYNSRRGIKRVPTIFCNNHEPLIIPVRPESYLDIDHLYVDLDNHLYGVDYQDVISICSKCLEKALLAQNVLSNGHLSCPLCYTHNEINLDILKPYLSESVFETLDQRLLNSILRRIPNIKYCPYPNCPLAIQIDPQCASFSCDLHGTICSKCSQPFHSGKTCQEVHREILDQEPNTNLFYHWTAQQVEFHDSVKECPGCSAIIHKIRGCSSVRCGNCGIHFNWDIQKPDWKLTSRVSLQGQGKKEKIL